MKQKLLSILAVISGLFLLSSCSSGPEGTYTWEYYPGYEVSLIIDSDDDKGPCTFIDYTGTKQKTSYEYYDYDTPKITVWDYGFYIDLEDEMVYYSSSDFDAKRNGTPVTID